MVTVTMVTEYLVLLLGSRDEKLTLPLSVSDDTSEIKPSVSDAELEKYRNLRHTINSSVEAKGVVTVTMITEYLLLLSGSSDEKLTLPLSVSDDTSEIKPSVSEAELEKYHNLHHDVTNSLKDKGLIAVTMVTECLVCTVIRIN